MNHTIDIVPEILKTMQIKNLHDAGIQICDGCNVNLIPIERAFCRDCDADAITSGRPSNAIQRYYTSTPMKDEVHDFSRRKELDDADNFFIDKNPKKYLREPNELGG